MSELTTQPKSAKVLAPAPVFYLAALAIGLALHYFFRIQLLPFEYALSVGVVLIMISMPIAVAAVNELMNAGTAFDARKPTTTLVTKGIFRVSRNPAYLSLALAFTGVAFIVNSLIVLVMVVIATMITLFGVILPEERYLRAVFGPEFIQYRKKVRRWI